MVSLILGNKGSGKTKRLIDKCNEAMSNSKGHVVFIEKEGSTSHSIGYRVRLVEADEYGIRGFDAFYGFISGMCAGNYDITDVFIDSTLKIGGGDMAELTSFIERLDILSKKANVNFVLTVSADKDDIPERIAKYA